MSESTVGVFKVYGLKLRMYFATEGSRHRGLKDFGMFRISGVRVSTVIRAWDRPCTLK